MRYVSIVTVVAGMCAAAAAWAEAGQAHFGNSGSEVDRVILPVAYQSSRRTATVNTVSTANLSYYDEHVVEEHFGDDLADELAHELAGGHDGHDGHGGHGDHGDHGHGHHEEHHDHLGSFHHRHALCDWPMYRMLVTEPAFLERALVFDVDIFNNTSHGDETEFKLELAWAFNNRLGFIVEAPVVYLDDPGHDTESGIGDFIFGLRWVGFSGPRTVLTFGLNVITATGDHDRNLGSGHAAFEPMVLLLHQFCNGTILHSEFKLELSVDNDHPEDVFIYNVALGQPMFRTKCGRYARYVMPLIEFNGHTELNGGHTGDTIVELVPGVRWSISEKNYVGFGYAFPISGSERWDDRAIFSFVHDF